MKSAHFSFSLHTRTHTCVCTCVSVPDNSPRYASCNVSRISTECGVHVDSIYLGYSQLVVIVSAVDLSLSLSR